MRVKVQCHCGWRRELSGFYAGKRIRCADCQAVLEVPGDSDDGAYLYPPMRNWPSGRHVRPQGVWVPVAQAGARSKKIWQRREVRYFPAWWKVLLFILAGVLLIGVLVMLTRFESRSASPVPEPQPEAKQEAPPEKDAPETAPADDDFETEQVDEF